MSHSSQHTLKRKLRASQKAKESRVVRNASRAKFRRVMPPSRLIRFIPRTKETPMKPIIGSPMAPEIPSVHTPAPAKAELSKDQVLALRKKPWRPWWKRLFDWGKKK